MFEAHDNSFAKYVNEGDESVIKDLFRTSKDSFKIAENCLKLEKDPLREYLDKENTEGEGLDSAIVMVYYFAECAEISLRGIKMVDGRREFLLEENPGQS